MLHPWPDSFPQELWPTIIDLVKGKVPEQPYEAYHALWHAIGFISGKYDPYHPQPMFADMKLDRENCAAYLEAAFVAPSDHVMGAVPWALVLQVMLQVLAELLKK